ncbi:MAG: putative ATP-dependent helicase DinG [Flavobacteriia bacterium]|nr:MAG: putative ATP-dependent helicase DinG [Flavobacteriia bacterium]
MYVVLDVESTGGPIDKDAIIEIALYRFDGEKIVDQLISLVHTERPIQPFVQRMTGITPKMIRSAPRWQEIAKRVVEITEGAILVGHGVSFDYRMVRQEFARLGYDYERSTIDTVNWSRKLFPGEDSYKLTSLCSSLGIWLPRNHRAGDDARATVDLFRRILDKDVENRIRSMGKLGDAKEQPSERHQKLIRDIKDEAGIYYLYDKDRQLLRSGLAEKLNGELSKIFLSPEAEDVRIQQEVAELQCERTGSKMIAQLKLHAGGDLLPAEARGTAVYWDEECDQLCLRSGVSPEEEQLAFFLRASDAKKVLSYWLRRFKLCTVEKPKNAKWKCRSFHAKWDCASSCKERHSELMSSDKKSKLLQAMRLETGSLQIRLPGRDANEKVLVQANAGRCGYLFFRLEKEVLDEAHVNKNETHVLLDPLVCGLIWRAHIRYPAQSKWNMPESLLMKPSI